jgi:AraC-like DNA-binding protein
MSNLANKLIHYLPEAGSIQGRLPNSSFFRVDHPQPLTPLVYNPSIYFVVQGEKEAWLHDQRFVYNRSNYLLLTIPLPLRCRVFNAEPGEPFLAVRFDINLNVLNELLNELPDQNMATDQSDSGIFVSPTTDALADSVQRFVATLEQPEQHAVLAPIYYKEVLFHVLQGPQSRLLRNFATADRHNNRIAQAINYIHRHFNRSVRIEELASIAAMSPSTFHEHFKNVTHHSPLQYLKNVRLHHAKHQIFVDQLPVNEAAFNVGYESPSQFSREYKRMFGLSPAKHLIHESRV